MTCTKALHLLAVVAILLPAAPRIAAQPAPSSAVTAQASHFTPLQVDRQDAALDRIIPAGAKLERIATGFTWTEGPVWAQGSLYFADIPANRIHKWTPGIGVSIFLEPSGYKGPHHYNGIEPGSNGMTLDARGRLTVAGHAQRDVYRLESLDPQAPITILADTYKGKQLNSPNDVVYKSDGSL